MMYILGHTSIQVLLYTAIFSVSYCDDHDDVQKIELFFNSHNCDEFPRRVSVQKEYTLTWLGQREPRLCDFNFTGGANSESSLNYEVCFESIEMKLPHSNMEILVQNKSEKWQYDGYARSIPKTCAKKAYKMMFKIVLDSNYKDSSSWVLKLKITAHKLPEEEEGIGSTILRVLGNALETIIPIAIIVIVGFCFLRNKQTRDRLLSNVRNFTDRCFKGSSSPRDPPSSNNERGSVILSTENHQPEISEFTRLSDSTDPSDTNRLSHEFTAPPPSYDEVQKMKSQDNF